MITHKRRIVSNTFEASNSGANPNPNASASVDGGRGVMSTRARRRGASNDRVKFFDIAGSAREFRELMPRIWREFRSNGSDADTTMDVGTSGCAVVTQRCLKKWLGSFNNPCSGLAKTSDLSFRRLVKAVTKLARKRQRLGVRFKDPSKNGTWGVENLVGYTASKKTKCCSEVTWDYYVSIFNVSLSTVRDDLVMVRRTVEKKALSTTSERRKRVGCGKALPQIRELFTVTATSRCQQAQDRRKKIKMVRRALDLLPAVIYRPLAPCNSHRWTLIYLHGLGSSALHNYADRPHFFMDGSVAVKVVIPTAPSRELSIFDSWWVPVQERKIAAAGTIRACRSRPKQKLQQFFAWYDYLTNRDGKREDDVDLKSLHEVRRALHSVIFEESKELGGRTDRIIVGGKSQGCCQSMDATLTFPQPLGGCIGIVGHLLSCTPVEPGGPQVKTPFHLFHEPEDHLMRWEWVHGCQQRLKDAGYTVYSRRQKDPEGHGHFVDGVEGIWIRQALKRICTAA